MRRNYQYQGTLKGRLNLLTVPSPFGGEDLILETKNNPFPSEIHPDMIVLFPNVIWVCGTRDFDDNYLFELVMNQLLKNLNKKEVCIISGDSERWNNETRRYEACGADKLAKEYAINHKYSYCGFPADWKKFGKPAGMIRNNTLCEYATGCIAFWDEESTGTLGSINLANKKGIPVRTIPYLNNKIVSMWEERHDAEQTTT